jgi:hypothetical protein
MGGEFTIEYVELPDGRAPAREFVDSLDDKAAARLDAFIERLRVYGNRVQDKFVKQLTGDIFELRVAIRPDFPGSLFLSARNANRDYLGFSEKDRTDSANRDREAIELRRLWMKYRNHYTGSQKEREAILKELGL